MGATKGRRENLHVAATEMRSDGASNEEYFDHVDVDLDGVVKELSQLGSVLVPAYAHMHKTGTRAIEMN